MENTGQIFNTLCTHRAFDPSADRHFILPSSESSKKEARHLVSLEIDKLKTCLANLKTHYNSLSTSGCLPFEILSRIFHYTTMVSDFKSQRKVLFAICRVCSTWRTVALGSPFLWSNVFFDCPLFDVGWVNEAISRSQKTELSIEATIYDLSTFANFKKVLQENITRIRSMAILSANRLLEELCFSLTIEPTILQNLTLEALHEFVMPPPIKVPPSFVPRLRTLVLSKCWISFESPLFRHTYLTTLVIEGDLGTPASFVELLRSFPKLQTLQLDRQKGTVMTPMSSSNAPPVKSVHLAELRTFTLSADNLTAQTVLSLLQIPRDANLRLEISLQCHIDLDFFADEFHRSVTGTDEIRSLSLGRVNDNIEMRVWPSDNLQVGDDSRVTMILSTVGSYWQRNLLLLFETFLGSFIFDHLEVLHVHDVEFTRDNWRSIFGPLPSLKTIRVQETKFALQHELRLALGDISVRGRKSRLAMYKLYPPPIPPRDPTSFLFRSLQTLIGVNWSLQPLRPLWSFPLVNCLRERKAAGLVLQSLHLITRRKIDEEDAESLAMLAEHFSWEKLTRKRVTLCSPM